MTVVFSCVGVLVCWFVGGGCLGSRRSGRRLAWLANLDSNIDGLPSSQVTSYYPERVMLVRLTNLTAGQGIRSRQRGKDRSG